MTGLFLASLSWSDLTGVSGTDAKLDYVDNVLFAAQDAFCPMEHFTVKTHRHPFASAKLAHLSKLKSREFKKNRYSDKFKRLKKACKEEIRAAQQRRIQEAVKAGSSNNSWLGKLEQLLDPSGKSSRAPGVLPEHLEAGFEKI